MYWHHHHHITTVLRSFFRDQQDMSRCQKRTSGLMVQGEINRGRHTDHPAGHHSIRTNQCPPPPHPFFTGRMPFLPPNPVKALMVCIDNQKNLLNSNISSICPHNIVNLGLPAAEIGLGVWGTTISMGFACWLRYCSDVAGNQSTRHTVNLSHRKIVWLVDRPFLTKH